MNEPRVVAVVVTFDRRDLLARLLARLSHERHLAEIVVVDNASTDGTADLLADVCSADTSDVDRPPVHVVRLESNTGGAGGFHAGMLTAVERGADLLWLMDDDGLPADGCLETLLVRRGDYDFWGPAVLAEQDPGRLCFPIRLPGRATVVHAMAEVEAAARDGVLEGIVIPFNGVLATRALVEEIGPVRAELFIWGDDVEWRLRAERAGARIATLVDAHFLHPATDDLGTPMMFGRTTYNHSASDLKGYCMARNNVANLREYRGLPAVAAFVAKTLWFYTLTRRDPARLRLSLGAMHDGMYGRWGRERRFL